MVFGIRLFQPDFESLRHRAWRVSVLASFSLHAALVAGLTAVAVRAHWGIPSQSPHVEAGSVAVLPDKSLPTLEMTEVAPPEMTPGTPDGVDPTLYRSRVSMGVKEQSKRKPDDLLKDLNALLGQAASIDDNSLKGIGLFLGKTPGEYKVRTHYKDELNRNADFSTSRVVRAATYPHDEGDTGYTIAMRDAEGDEYIFTLEGEPAAPLHARSLTFDGQPLGKAGPGEPFEWKGARLTDIRRWKREEDKVGMRGALVTFEDANQQQIELALKGERYKPFLREMQRFMRLRMGHKSDGSTPYSDGFDFDSATLQAPKEDDIWHEDDELRVRSVLIDRKGERFISILKGGDAERHLNDTQALRNPLVRRIYESTLKHRMSDELKANE